MHAPTIPALSFNLAVWALAFCVVFFCSAQIVNEQGQCYSVSPISVRLRAIRQAPITAASVPSDDVNTGTSWLISLNEYWRIANLMYCRK